MFNKLTSDFNSRISIIYSCGIKNSIGLQNLAVFVGHVNESLDGYDKNVQAKQISSSLADLDLNFMDKL